MTTDVPPTKANTVALSEEAPLSGQTLLLGLSLAMIGAIAFSAKAIVIKLAYRYQVDWVTLIAYRVIFALPLFLALAWWSGRGKPPLTLRDWLGILGLGVTGGYLTGVLDFAGLQYVTASLERLIIYLTPTFVLLIDVIAFKRPFSARHGIALAVSYLGVLLVFGREVSFSGQNALLGAALVLGSAISYAVYLAYSGQEVRRLGALRLTGWATSVASVLCIVQFLALKPVSALAVDAPVIWLSVVNGTACTFVPVLLVMLAIERIGAPLAAQTGMVGPVATILMGVAILGEPFTAWVAVGTCLVIAGIWMLARARVMAGAENAR